MISFLRHQIHVPILLSILFLWGGCRKNISGADSQVDNNSYFPSAKPPSQPAPGPSDVGFWLTKGNQSALLQKQSVPLVFGTPSNRYSTIIVDSAQRFQTMDGFGYTLTSGSCDVINRLGATQKADLLNELFGTDTNSIGISYLRVSIGASDLSASVYSYDDMPEGQTDTSLEHFSLAPDLPNVIPLLKEILAVRPTLKIMGTPWLRCVENNGQ